MEDHSSPFMCNCIMSLVLLLIRATLAWQTNRFTVEYSSGFTAGEVGERLFLVLKRDEMELEWADKCVSLGSLPGSYLGLACHCMWIQTYIQYRLLLKCCWGCRPVLCLLWGCSQLSANYLKNFGCDKHSFCPGSLIVYNTGAGASCTSPHTK